ncbi:MAG: peptidyl-prolyl cis-trans isomerase [Treponema sp.]|nr:peptidyl-prolyl cis-trans isomerase [Treponema sp.]
MKRIISLLILAAALAVPGFTQSDLQPAAIVRLTKSEPITVKQYRTEVERYEKQAGRALNSTEKRQVLDVMINEKLASQAAERDKVTITDNEVNQSLQQLKNELSQTIQRQPTEAEWAAFIKNQTGLELPAYREQLKKQLLIQKYLMEKKRDSFSSLKAPTEEEIKNTYSLARAELVRPETVRFSMIRVPFTDTVSKAKAREIVDRLVREIGNNPAKFDEAVAKGRAPNSEYQAGDGGYLPRNTQAQQKVGAEFITTAFNLKQGEVSKMIETSEGFHIIKITETYEQKDLGLDDVIQPGTRVTVRDYISSGLQQQQEQELIEKVTQELVAELRAGNPYQIYESNLNW